MATPFYAGLVGVTVAGSLYLFPVISSRLRHSLDIDSAQISTLTTLVNAGTWLGVLPGVFYDRVGALPSSAMAMCLLFGGYLMLAMAAYGTWNLTVGWLYVAGFAVGQGSSFAYLVPLLANATNAGQDHIGKLMGLFQCGFSLASGILTQFYSVFFSKHKIADFIFFLAAYLPFAILATVFLLYKLPGKWQAAFSIDQHIQRGMKVALVVIVLIAISAVMPLYVASQNVFAVMLVCMHIAAVLACIAMNVVIRCTQGREFFRALQSAKMLEDELLEQPAPGSQPPRSQHEQAPVQADDARREAAAGARDRERPDGVGGEAKEAAGPYSSMRQQAGLLALGDESRRSPDSGVLEGGIASVFGFGSQPAEERKAGDEEDCFDSDDEDGEHSDEDHGSRDTAALRRGLEASDGSVFFGAVGAGGNRPRAQQQQGLPLGGASLAGLFQADPLPSESSPRYTVEPVSQAARVSLLRNNAAAGIVADQNKERMVPEPGPAPESDPGRPQSPNQLRSHHNDARSQDAAGYGSIANGENIPRQQFQSPMSPGSPFVAPAVVAAAAAAASDTGPDMSPVVAQSLDVPAPIAPVTNTSHVPLDITASQALRMPEFWLLYTVFVIGVGGGITLLDNLPDLVDSHSSIAYGNADLAYVKVKAGAVAFFAASNALGRLMMGYASDELSSRYSRLVFLVLTSVSMGVAHLLAIPDSVALLFLAICIGGFAYGGFWGLVPALQADIWPLKHYGTIHGLMNTAAVLGSYLFYTLLSSKVYSAHEDMNGYCFDSIACFQNTFLIIAGMNLVLAPILVIVLEKRRKEAWMRFYADGGLAA